MLRKINAFAMCLWLLCATFRLTAFDINNPTTLLDASFFSYDTYTELESEKHRDAFINEVKRRFPSAELNELTIREISTFLFDKERIVAQLVSGSTCSPIKVFKDKSGHCAALSIVYACVFEILGFEYELCFIPEHVFISVKIKEDRIFIETTDKGRFYYSIVDYAKAVKAPELFGEDYIIKMNAREAIGFILCDSSRFSKNSRLGLQYATRGVEISNSALPCLSILYQQKLLHGNINDAKLIATECYKRARSAHWSQMAVFYAVSTDNIENVIESIRKGGALDYVTTGGKTVGHEMISREMAQFLFYCGVDLNQADCQGDCPIHKASSRGLIDVVAWMLEIGISSSQANTRGATPLLLAAYDRHSDLVKYLINTGASIFDKTNEGYNLLHISILRNNEIIDYCFEKGVPLEITGDGNSAATLAARFGNDIALKKLFANGASILDKNLEGASLIHLAVLSCNTPTIKFLLDKGINPDVQDFQGRTPLHYAVLWAGATEARLLLEHSVNLQLLDKEGLTSLDWARKLKRMDILEEIQKIRQQPGVQEKASGVLAP